MPRLKTIQEFISLLYSERKVLSWFFTGKGECDEKDQEFWAIINQDKSRLKRLVEAELLITENRLIRLNSRFSLWLSHFLHQTESPETGEFENLNQRLRRQVNYYPLIEDSVEKGKQRIAISQSLSALTDTIQATVEQIEDWLILSQMTRDNQPLFQAKVHDGQAALDKIVGMIEFHQHWMREATFFKNIEEISLLRAFLNYVDLLPIIKKHILEVKKEAESLLAGHGENTRLFHSFALLRKISDKNQLADRTNLANLLKEESPAILNPFQIQVTTPAKEALSTEALQELYRRFKTSEKNEASDQVNGSEVLSPEKTGNNLKQISRFKNQFAKSDQDLYTFLKNHPSLAEIAFQERVNLFFQMISLYESEWKIKDKWVEENGVRFVEVRSS